MEWNLSKYTLYFAVMVLLVTLVDCEFTTLYVVEGDVAFLTFGYSCNSTKVTLQRTHGAPFFDSEGSNSNVPSNMEVRNGTDGRECFLNLTVNPVTRSDRGGYILFAYQYKNDSSLYEDDRVWVNVGYPPGKASCSLIEVHIDPDWIQVLCTAPVGTVSGYIICYQDGNAIPPLNSRQENDATLSQTLLAKVGSLVYCCSSTLGKTRDVCECMDAVWDPIQNKEVYDLTYPCPPTPVPHLTFSKYPTESIPWGYTLDTSSTDVHTKSTIAPKQSSRTIVVLVVAICLLILGCVISIFCYLKQRAKLIKQRAKMIKNSKPVNEEQKPFTTISEV